ncbi:hypothetical protein [Desulfonatronospira sp.]|uniref:hypothetical protein n=1 Tax=Desulfonatronospira sp. TaxID=1962951 RepID=UPI0025C2764A|nr:hypothetical protein [Desulfonatronospira sp.]
MSWIFRLITLPLLILFLGGCTYYEQPYQPRPSQPVSSQVPVPTGYSLTTQKKMQAMQHWEVLAEDVACRIEDSLEMRAIAKGRYSIYVAPPGSTPFEKAFYNLLLTKMVHKGMRVSRSEGGAMVLSFDLELVRHSRRVIRTQRGVYKSLAPGMFVRRQEPGKASPSTIRPQEYLVAGAQVNVEAGAYTPEVPSMEVMVTTSLTLNDNYIMRDSSIYYINDTDWDHYKQHTIYRDPSKVHYRLVD